MNIPHLFTRVRICERCLLNQKPYPSSEDLKRHQLRFVVRTHDSEDMFKIRSQTKPGQVGFTPHMFKVSRAPHYTEEAPLYEVTSACAVENCGCTFRISGPNQIEFDFTFTRTEVMSPDQILAIYNYKDESLMLDSKEEQFHVTRVHIKNYFPN